MLLIDNRGKNFLRIFFQPNCGKPFLFVIKKGRQLCILLLHDHSICFDRCWLCTRVTRIFLCNRDNWMCVPHVPGARYYYIISFALYCNYRNIRYCSLAPNIEWDNTLFSHTISWQLFCAGIRMIHIEQSYIHESLLAVFSSNCVKFVIEVETFSSMFAGWKEGH